MLAEKNSSDAGGLPLLNAVFCLDCQMISSNPDDECRLCRGRSLVRLARILGVSLFAHRDHETQEGDASFDITITAELQRMHARDLTATLERLTGVMGPKLARDQATFRVHVKPSAGRFKSQGYLSFPERDAA